MDTDTCADESTHRAQEVENIQAPHARSDPQRRPPPPPPFVRSRRPRFALRRQDVGAGVAEMCRCWTLQTARCDPRTAACDCVDRPRSAASDGLCAVCTVANLQYRRELQRDRTRKRRRLKHTKLQQAVTGVHSPTLQQGGVVQAFASGEEGSGSGSSFWGRSTPPARATTAAIGHFRHRARLRCRPNHYRRHRPRLRRRRRWRLHISRGVPRA